MIEPGLRDRLTAVYATWLDQDDFGQRYVHVCGPHQDADVTSVQQFLGVNHPDFRGGRLV